MITGRLSAFIVLFIFIIASAIASLNYLFTYNEKKSYVQQDMKNYVKNRVNQLNAILTEKKSIDDVAYKTILHDYAHNNDILFFSAFIESDGRVIEEANLPNGFNIAKYLPKNLVLTNFGEDDEVVFVTTAINTPKPVVMLCGFTKASLSSSIFNAAIYFSILLFACLTACAVFIVLYIRSKIDKPMQYIFDANLQEFAGGILAANADCQKIKSIEETALPYNIKNRILDAFGMLQTWLCYKIHFDEFLTMTVAESNKQQLANNVKTKSSYATSKSAKPEKPALKRLVN